MSEVAKNNIEFHFDFGSPNAYLSHRVLPAIEKRTGAKFEYVPVLLGGVFKLTHNRSPVESFAGIKNKMEYAQLEMRRFVRAHAIDEFRMNPHFPVNTLSMMRGAVAAQDQGVFDRYVDAMFRAMWVDGRNMADAEIWQAAIREAGLDGARLVELSQSAAVKERLLANTARSVERGTFGAPTFFVGDEIFFGKDRLEAVEAEIERQRGR